MLGDSTTEKKKVRGRLIVCQIIEKVRESMREEESEDVRRLYNREEEGKREADCLSNNREGTREYEGGGERGC